MTSTNIQINDQKEAPLTLLYNLMNYTVLQFNFSARLRRRVGGEGGACLGVVRLGRANAGCPIQNHSRRITHLQTGRLLWGCDGLQQGEGAIAARAACVAPAGLRRARVVRRTLALARGW